MKTKGMNELRLARKDVMRGMGAVWLFSFLIALGALAPVVYTMQVMDRVLSSRSEPTLYALTALTGFVVILLGVMMFARVRLMTRLANRLDDKLGPRVFEMVFRIALEQPTRTSLQPVEDLLTVRKLISGNAMLALMDAPFIPLFFFALYIIHPLIGITALGFGVVNGVLLVLNSAASRNAIREGQQQGRKSSDFLLTSLRNADAVQSMGMLESLRLRWLQSHLAQGVEQTRGSDLGSIYGTAANTVRSSARIGVVAVAAYLILQLELSPGLLIAAMILTGRALSPLQSLISSWPQLMEGRLAYRRLGEMLEQYPPRQRQIRLPEPEGEIRVEAVVAGSGGQRGSGDPPILRGVSLSVRPGETLAILGASGSGKTTLARVMLGLWPVLSGKVRFDGADVRHWDPLQFGRYVGYLPQDIQLFSGTIADNIARFGRVRSEKIVAAAKLAGVHSMILNLGKGYLTEIGPGGIMLSAGQRQRIGLARALYDYPRFVIMDEPNSNLDEEGHAALMFAIEELKRAGSSIVFISHRRTILSKADQVLVLANGQVRFFGAREAFYAAYAGNSAEGQAGVVLSGPTLASAGDTKLTTPRLTRDPPKLTVEPYDDAYDADKVISRWRPIRVAEPSQESNPS
ncbi:type I secretion system permease/ATPase [Thiorhodococcus mannitoliphagus]|uniref:Type I secretion system permease/ATPase n=1 Tax=Thiorhodococcus mannitoliphagus TaxID=329406 RepID=A0A6P1DRU6_9GAMM|nr:type I secretion system permease/ATPase [Thiorhodococcus mannitoliphagus]NEX19406.1 type I secretion system permease/ATPase [Thiorhodococcus mannitoliphagus]